MNCPQCHTNNEPDARLCLQCGATLPEIISAGKYQDMRRSLILILILLGWEIFNSVIWLFIQKAIVPLMTRGLDIFNYDRVGVIYKVTGMFLDIVSVAIGIVFLILVRHKGARALLIVYVVVRALMLIVYRIADLF
jgi:hypothetical protein